MNYLYKLLKENIHLVYVICFIAVTAYLTINYVAEKAQEPFEYKLDQKN